MAVPILTDKKRRKSYTNIYGRIGIFPDVNNANNKTKSNENNNNNQSTHL